MGIEQWGDPPTFNTPFDEVGDYKQRVSLQHPSIFNVSMELQLLDVIDQWILATHTSTSKLKDEDIIFYGTFQTEVLDAPISSQAIISKTTVKCVPDFRQLKPFFGSMSSDIIEKTFEHTTKYVRLPMGTMVKKAFWPSHPVFNIYRRNEDLAVDIIYSDVPAIFDGSTASIIFIGTSTKVPDVHGIKKDSLFVNTL
jgi:hypothetical protein